jgi:hypothetical protein
VKLANRQAGYLTSLFPYSHFVLNGNLALRGESATADKTERQSRNTSNWTPMENSEKPTRKRGRHLRVPVLPDEERAIKENADRAGLSVAAYLRNVGLGYQIRGTIDQDLILQLAKINADQGRLGGLLKLWLTNDEKLGKHDPEQMRRVIHGVLDRIIGTQGALLELARKE